MKRLVIGLGWLATASVGASGCDDTRPVVGIAPDGEAGEMSRAGAPSTSDGGGAPSTSGAPSLAGQNEGGRPAQVGGAGGAGADAAP